LKTVPLSISESGDSLSSVTFALADATDFGVCGASGICAVGVSSYTDSISAFGARVVSANNVGAETALTVSGQMSGGTVCLGDLAIVRTRNNPAWVQVKNGDILAKGNIRSIIPVSCVDSPSCDESLITYDNPGGSPGVATAGLTINLGASGNSRLKANNEDDGPSNHASSTT
jgi:hypothetical protein